MYTPQILLIIRYLYTNNLYPPDEITNNKNISFTHEHRHTNLLYFETFKNILLSRCTLPLYDKLKIRVLDSLHFLPGSQNYNYSDTSQYKLLTNLPSIHNKIIKYELLQLSGKKFPQEIANIIKSLITCEEKPGGPYKTFINEQDNERWNIINIDTNAYIASFLKKNKVILPRLNKYLRKSIARTTLISPSSFSQVISLCNLAKALDHEDASLICNQIIELQNESGYWENSLITSIVISTLRSLGIRRERLGRAYEYIRYEIDHTNFNFFPYVADMVHSKEEWYCGNTCHTLSYILNALCTYEEQDIKLEDKDIRAAQLICNKTRLRFTSAPPPFKKEILSMLEILPSSIEARSTLSSLSLLNNYLQLKSKKDVQDDVIKKVFELTCTGIITYRCIDDLIDEKRGLRNLPQASYLLRELMWQLTRFDAPTISMGTTLLNQLDAALQNELDEMSINIENGMFFLQPLTPTNTLDTLWHKSSGALLAPLLLCYLQGLNPADSFVIGLRSFFKHYLIARQLNDDAHDWKEDIERGRLNPISKIVLRDVVEKHGYTFPLTIEKTVLIRDMKEMFWTHSISESIQLIRKHIKKAEKISEINNLPIEYTQFLLKPLKTSIVKAQEDYTTSHILSKTIFRL